MQFETGGSASTRVASWIVPASAIADVSGERVTLSVDKDRVDDKGWDHRPDWLRDED